MTALLLFCLSACSAEQQEGFVRSFADDSHLQIGEQAVDAILTRDAEAIRSLVAPEHQSHFSDEAMTGFFGPLPTADPVGTTLTKFNKSVVTSTSDQQITTVQLIYLVYFDPDQSEIERARLSVRLQGPSDTALTLVNLNFRDMTIPADQTATRLTPIVGFLAIAVAVFCLITLAVAMRTPRLKRRILWSLFIAFVGMPAFAFITPGEIWRFLGPGLVTNGEAMTLQIFNFKLLSAGFSSDFITGFTQIEVAVPLGALLFWLQKARGKLALKPPKGQSEADDKRPSPPADSAAD